MPVPDQGEHDTKAGRTDAAGRASAIAEPGPTGIPRSAGPSSGDRRPSRRDVRAPRLRTPIPDPHAHRQPPRARPRPAGPGAERPGRAPRTARGQARIAVSPSRAVAHGPRERAACRGPRRQADPRGPHAVVHQRESERAIAAPITDLEVADVLCRVDRFDEASHALTGAESYAMYRMGKRPGARNQVRDSWGGILIHVEHQDEPDLELPRGAEPARTGVRTEPRPPGLPRPAPGGPDQAGGAGQSRPRRRKRCTRAR